MTAVSSGAGDVLRGCRWLQRLSWRKQHRRRTTTCCRERRRACVAAWAAALPAFIAISTRRSRRAAATGEPRLRTRDYLGGRSAFGCGIALSRSVTITTPETVRLWPARRTLATLPLCFACMARVLPLAFGVAWHFSPATYCHLSGRGRAFNLFCWRLNILFGPAALLVAAGPLLPLFPCPTIHTICLSLRPSGLAPNLAFLCA